MSSLSYPSVAVLFLCSCILLAHVLAPETYLWTEHTVSHLAAQGYARKGLMQTGFVGFGLILCVGVAQQWNQQHLRWWVDVPIAVYAGAIVLSGIYCTAPFVKGLPYHLGEAQIHSICATVAGVAFSIGLFASAWQAMEPRARSRHWFFLAYVLVLSASLGYSTAYAGLLQKLMYAGSFIWLVHDYQSQPFVVSDT